MSLENVRKAEESLVINFHNGWEQWVGANVDDEILRGSQPKTTGRPRYLGRSYAHTDLYEVIALSNIEHLKLFWQCCGRSPQMCDCSRLPSCAVPCGQLDLKRP